LAEHYFSADPSVPFTRAPVRARVWGHDLELESGSGVFAQGRLDIGTSVLLRETAPPGPGRYLDLGCGYGVIGLAIAVAQASATVDAVDVNERALLLASDNAVSLGVADRYIAATPSAAALSAASSRARSLTSTASTVAPGWATAIARPITPYPQPRSR